MAFDGQGVASKLFGFGIADRKAPLVLRWNVDGHDRLSRARVAAVDHLGRLRAESLG